MATIKMEDIHSGYLVVRRDEKLMLCTRVNQKNFTKIFCNGTSWTYASAYDENLKCKIIINGKRREEYDIMEVYGLVTVSDSYHRSATPFHIGSVASFKEDRPLLWKREEPIRMTHKELCEFFGKEIEIIPE